MGERAPLGDSDLSRGTAGDNILVPRALAISLILGMPGTIGCAAWYMASQAADSHHLAETQALDSRRLADALLATRADVMSQQAAQNIIIKQTSDALARLDHDQNDIIGRIDLRLTRLEAQMNFLIGTNAPARRP